MQKITLFFVIFTSLNCLSADNVGLIEGINKLNKASLEDEVIDPRSCVDCFPNQILAKQCLMDICDKNPVKKSYSQIKDALLKSNQKLIDEYKNEIAPAIYAAATKDLETEIFEMEQSLAVIQEKKLDVQGSTLDAIFRISTLNMSGIDTSDPLISEYFANTQPILRELRAKLETNSLEEDPEVWIKTKYPNTPIKEALFQEAKRAREEIKRSIEIVAQNAHPAMVTVIEDQAKNQFLEMAEKRMDVDIKSANNIVNTGRIASFLADLFTNAEFAEQINKIDKTKLSEYLHSDIVIEKLKANIKKLKEFKNNPKNLEEIYGNCITNYAVARVGLPKKSDLASLEKKANSYRANFLERLKVFLSSHTQSVLLPKISGINFIFPQATEDFKTNSQILIKDATRELVVPKDQETIVHLDYAFDIAFKYSPANYEDDQYREYVMDDVIDLIKEEQCKKLNPSIVSDAAYSHTGDTRISWGSLLNQDGLDTVLAHELGHVMFNLLKTNVISKESASQLYPLIECLNANHMGDPNNIFVQTVLNRKAEDISPQYSPVNTLYSQTDMPQVFVETYYTSEDFADLISAYVNREAGKNVGCYLLNASSVDDNNYSHFSLRRKYDDDDNHSSNLYRVLAVEMHQKGALPKSCESLADRQDIEFKSCMPKTTK